MKLIFAIFMAFAFDLPAGSQNGSAVEYHFGKSYALVAATDLRIFIELRAYDHDQPTDSVVLDSRYMPPEFEAQDVAFDGTPEFIVHTRDGGTGLAETHLAVYGIVGQHIKRFCDFVVERRAESWPDLKQEEKLSGNVTFPKKNELLYRYTQIATNDGKTVTNSVVRSFLFNQKVGRYEETKRP